MSTSLNPANQDTSPQNPLKTSQEKEKASLDDNEFEDEDKCSFNNKALPDLFNEVKSIDTDKTLKQIDHSPALKTSKFVQHSQKEQK